MFLCLFVPLLVRSFAWLYQLDVTRVIDFIMPIRKHIILIIYRHFSGFSDKAGKPREVETGKIIALSELSNFERTIEQDRKSRGTKTLITCWQT